MKIIVKISVILYFVLQHNIYSQQLVKNLNELYKLKENEQLFINRPLKNHLQEIKPELKTGSVLILMLLLPTKKFKETDFQN